VEFGVDFLEADGGIWRDVLAHLVLSRMERDTWRKIGRSEQRRTEWLLGRIAAKDAIRFLLRDHYGLRVYPSDIEINADENGRPVPHLRTAMDWVCKPTVSITHDGAIAAAIASIDSSVRGLGIDIQNTAGVNAELRSLAFSEQERALLDSVSMGRQQEWSTRLWCAKEAAAKALGCGFSKGPQSVQAQAFDDPSGTIVVAPSKELLERSPQYVGVRVKTTSITTSNGSLVAASAVWE